MLVANFHGIACVLSTVLKSLKPAASALKSEVSLAYRMSANLLAFWSLKTAQPDLELPRCEGPRFTSHMLQLAFEIL